MLVLFSNKIVCCFLFFTGSVLFNTRRLVGFVMFWIVWYGVHYVDLLTFGAVLYGGRRIRGALLFGISVSVWKCSLGSSPFLLTRFRLYFFPISKIKLKPFCKIMCFDWILNLIFRYIAGRWGQYLCAISVLFWFSRALTYSSCFDFPPMIFFFLLPTLYGANGSAKDPTRWCCLVCLTSFPSFFTLYSQVRRIQGLTMKSRLEVSVWQTPLSSTAVLYRERFIEQDRHIEFQIFGDRSGSNCVWWPWLLMSKEDTKGYWED